MPVLNSSQRPQPDRLSVLLKIPEASPHPQFTLLTQSLTVNEKFIKGLVGRVVEWLQAPLEEFLHGAYRSEHVFGSSL